MCEYYIGVMSGTSLDGVDVALCGIDTHTCKLIEAYEHPFPKALKKEILHTIANDTSLKQLGELDVKLGELFAEAINALLQNSAISRKEICAIGLHGQTLWHEPISTYPFSMQLGNANVVVAQTDISTVADFRGADIANGGEGAPFAPAFHREIFARDDKNIAVVNIGGMANITYLGKEFLGWDTGCGNVLMDSFIQKIEKKPYDRDGAFAKSGRLNMDLLQKMLKDSYFAKEPPKSTGREYFNLEWLEKYLKNFVTVSDADIQRTLLELTASSIANAINRLQSDELILCGGGAKNSFLVERLKKLCRCEVRKSDDYGMNSDFLEAMLFAWLAYKRLHNEKVPLSSITGAKKDSLLGAIYG
ncbi:MULTISPECIES: anhydro-N-acetylmuramic acid kinase [Sulfurimonas]|uniref:anhydro-N-acetylmuramic acid kinase n=1 Tax=Sulfurimonas TaxID=202746 RepID=UPI0012654512|nr:anhydro-N-acetylmuramic acid kinase [Sulfurimonas indica]